jgi:hypothetical protein
LLLVGLLAGCGIGPTMKSETLAHGPFEIVATGHRISSGGFPNTSGNPFSTTEVTGFNVRWKGKRVAVEGQSRFWRVLRLLDAPRPALLLATTHFTLIYEQDGQLVVKDFGATSGGMAHTQWLDERNGQPGPTAMYGIEKTTVDAGTALRGGRWLRLSDATVIDTRTLSTHTLVPWLGEGDPFNGVSAGTNSQAFAFSPGQTQFVASGSEFQEAGSEVRTPTLMVLDIPTGRAYALKIDRKAMRYRDQQDITPAWVNHYFAWQRDAQGHERLVARANVKPAPWAGRIIDFGHQIEYRIAPVGQAMNAELARFLVERMGATPAPDWMDPTKTSGGTFTVPGCGHVIATSLHDDHVGVFVPTPKQPPWVRCQDTVRTIAAAFDAELATGRLDALFVAHKPRQGL